MPLSFDNRKIYLILFLITTFGAISALTNGCAKNKNVALECVSNHILANIEQEKIGYFIKLDGVTIWREGWTNMTSAIAKDHFVVEKCGVRQYLAQFNP